MSERYDAVVFDNDGVLTHPTRSDVVHEAVTDTFREFDVEPTDETFEHARHAVVDGVETFADVHGIDPATFWERRETNVAAAQRREMETGRKPLYDDFDAVYELGSNGLDLGVVSNNQHETIEHIVDVFDLDGVFETTLGREPTLDGLRRKKPEPHYVERALEHIGCDSALYVGDSGVDVLAADAAGLDSAFVRRPHREDYELPAEPTYEIESLSELLHTV
jgi:HAD superfamily hydrolase (TIGR01549 family)